MKNLVYIRRKFPISRQVTRSYSFMDCHSYLLLTDRCWGKLYSRGVGFRVVWGEK